MMLNTLTYKPTSRQVLAYFKNICVACGHPACVVHEIEPRSHGHDPLRFENRVALCGDCHDFFHNQGISKKNMENLRFLRENRIKMLYGDNPPNIDDVNL